MSIELDRLRIIHANGSLSPINTLVVPHVQYEALGSDDQTRHSAYGELFRYHLVPGIVDEIRAATNGNYALGSSRFKAQVSTALGRRATPRKSGRPGKQEKTFTSDLFEKEI